MAANPSSPSAGGDMSSFPSPPPVRLAAAQAGAAIQPSSPRYFFSSLAGTNASPHRRIAIAVDLSDESAFAVQWAVQNYLRPGDAVVLLHVRLTSVLYGADWGSIPVSVSDDAAGAEGEDAPPAAAEGAEAASAEELQKKREEDFDAFTSTKAQDLAQPLVDAQIPFKIHVVKDHDMKERLCLEAERLGLPRFEVEVPWLNLLSNILFLSLKGCKLVKLPESICELNSLRYLDISHSRVQVVPEKFWCLCSLQVFDATRSSLQTIHQDVTKLVNLRRLALTTKCSDKLPKLSGLGNLSSLRNLSCFKVGKENGRRISELKGMNQLTGRLSITSIANVQSMEEAAEARLVDKQYLKELVLNWQGHYSRLRSGENGVLEALRPPSRIERLQVQGFGGDKSPSWLNPENLPTLTILEVSGCRCLRYLPIPLTSLEQLVLSDLAGIEAITSFADGTRAGSTGDDRTQHRSSSSSSIAIAHRPLTRLTTLRLFQCRKLASLDQFLSPEYLPSIKSIEIMYCWDLVSLPVHTFVGFICLQDLKICGCNGLVCPREMVLPPSLRRLYISICGGLDKSFPGCLEGLTSLILLVLTGCDNVESIPFCSIDTSKLKCLLLHDCSELSSIGGPHALLSIQHVQISGCTKLTEIQQPFEKKGLGPKEVHELTRFVK